jgi:hypothetical protein
MTLVKVLAKYYVDAPSWVEAETLVEQGQVSPDTIESEPGTNTARDIIAFGLSKQIGDEHRKIFFDDDPMHTYEEKKEELAEKTLIWLRTILHEILESNEEHWS